MSIFFQNHKRDWPLSNPNQGFNHPTLNPCNAVHLNVICKNPRNVDEIHAASEHHTLAGRACKSSIFPPVSRILLVFRGRGTSPCDAKRSLDSRSILRI
jgi:hypothetical protein